MSQPRRTSSTARAFVSACAQFLCGILFILGLWTRQAGAVMVINFLFALLIAHRAGKLSVDDWVERRPGSTARPRSRT